MNQDNPYLDDEIDFAELFKALWEGRKLIIIITTVFAIGSVVFSLSLTNYYRSESLLVARTNNQASSSLSQFSGLASMAGISLPGSGDNKAMEAIEIIKSRAFLKHLLAFENILPSIMAPKSFDNGSKKLLLDPKVYDSESNTWKKKSNKSFQKPSYLEAYEVYSKNMVSIGQDEMTGFISIYVEHISPVFAKEFLELIIREANLILRQQDIEESSQALQYLKSELAKI